MWNNAREFGLAIAMLAIIGTRHNDNWWFTCVRAVESGSELLSPGDLVSAVFVDSDGVDLTADADGGAIPWAADSR